jgi:protein arginine kinase activator
MMCEDCNKNKATINFTQIINNKKTVLNLCRTCAEKRGFSEIATGATQSFGVGNLVSKIADEYEEESNTLTCGKCGLTYLDFKQSGRLGCGTCYAVFGKRLDDLLRKIHGASSHIGKIPRNVAPDISQNRQVETLRRDIKQAIEREDFETAARLRDQIKKMEVKNG